MLEILLIIAPLFLIIFAAAIYQKAQSLGENWSKILNAYALNIGFPILIFSALASTSFSFTREANLIIFNSSFLIITFALSYLLGKAFRLKKQMFRTIFICLGFGNVAYLGVPVLTQTQGQSILASVSIIIAIYLFWMFTIGIGYLDYSQHTKKRHFFKSLLLNLLKNPLLIAVILGLLFAGLKIPIPEIVQKSLSMITASVTPVVLIVIGLFIGKSTIGKITNWIPVLLFSLVTLFLLPAIFYFGIQPFGFQPTEFSPSIIEAAMPLAITPFALADKFKLNKQFIARSIVLSTILSVISLPFWISLFA
jgi:predicted permease